ncbi:harpin HrpZ family protein [Pseudomonas syringae pv. tagetis]|uniref:Harpin HrpZ n=1 Tax=Pseudomonas syringae pv. tagetis TaxID=129140 RepID=Q2LJ20_9PSED|nr:type III secretion system effector HrpZ [Pseudomonas syringae group genomosp. 7]ABB91660.1 type III helper protein HrpZ [Pseudomonas syringae pv. tagetis]KPY88377.1 Type III helper protein HrpZ [Pseudomonas syringae pv. tagetis]RMR05884.1 Type III helper protein HrpZ [Pseudomonas syringae pv. helianthi]RMW15031.1 Type III helper protein HrpZ [Pseudomonas syringae pv. tagetis]RMW23179.1 Type III helper protein HrpZ [Pseudomonas syringae pv. tagetis]
MQALNSFNSLQTSASLFPVSLDNDATSSASTSSKELKAVIDQLVQALTKNGQLDDTSPLGKMLAKAMAADGKSGGSIADITAALDKLIHEKLGDNFGASAGIGGGAGSGSGAGGGQLDGASGGQSDLMNQVLNGLGKAVLDNLLTPSGEGGTTFSSDDMPILEKVAQFMDDNKAQFPTRDGGSWMNELKEDNGLDGQETAQFRSALDILGQQLGQQQSDASGLSGSGGGGLGSPVSDSAGAPASLGDPAIDANTGPAANGNGNIDVGQLIGQLIDRGLQASGGGLGTPTDNSTQPGTTNGNLSNQDLGQLLEGLLQKGLEATLKDATGAGNDLQASAAQTVAQILNTLLQSSNNQAVA